MPTISIADPLQINAIVWIGSVPAREAGASRRMLDDLADLEPAGGFPVFEHQVGNRQELFEVLDQVAADAANGLRPILHFDSHGNPNAGMSLAPSGEWASWSDLMDRLRVINVATGNNLVVVFALCCGLNLYKLVELKKAVPAYLFVAPSETVKLGFLMDEVPKFYRLVKESGAFLGPFAATLGKEMNIFNCQGLLLQALAHYVRTQCTGEVLEARIERTVPKLFKRDGIVNPTPEQWMAARDNVRSALVPGSSLIDRYAPEFLVGRQPGFTYDQVKAVAEAVVVGTASPAP